MAQEIRDLKTIKRELADKKKSIARTLELYDEDVDALNGAAAKKAKREKAAGKKSTEKNVEALASANAYLEDCTVRYQTQGQMLDDDLVALNSLYEEMIAALEEAGKNSKKMIKEQADAIASFERTKSKIEKRVRVELPEIDLSIDDMPEETPVEEIPAEETPVEEIPAEEEPIEETPAEEAPVEEAPAEEEPIEETPAEEAPAEEAPVEETPVEETPVEETPAEETPVEEAPAVAPIEDDEPAVAPVLLTDERIAALIAEQLQ